MRMVWFVLAVGLFLAGCSTPAPAPAGAEVGPTAGQARYLQLVRDSGLRGDDEQLLSAARAVCDRGLPAPDQQTTRWVEDTASELLMYGFVESAQDGRTVAYSAEPACG